MDYMCVRCRENEAPEPLGLCPTCVVHTRIELSDGFRRLSRYLGAWSAFDDWLRRQAG